MLGIFSLESQLNNCGWFCVLLYKCSGLWDLFHSGPRAFQAHSVQKFFPGMSSLVSQHLCWLLSQYNSVCLRNWLSFRKAVLHWGCGPERLFLSTALASLSLFMEQLWCCQHLSLTQLHRKDTDLLNEVEPANKSRSWRSCMLVHLLYMWWETKKQLSSNLSFETRMLRLVHHSNFACWKLCEYDIWLLFNWTNKVSQLFYADVTQLQCTLMVISLSWEIIRLFKKRVSKDSPTSVDYIVPLLAICFGAIVERSHVKFVVWDTLHI